MGEWIIYGWMNMNKVMGEWKNEWMIHYSPECVGWG